MNDLARSWHYDQASPSWARRMDRLGYSRAYREIAGRVLQQIKLPGRICDIGCGSGCFSLALSRVNGGTFPCLTLIDPSARMLQAAATALGPHCDVLICQNTDLTGAAGRFDMVLAAHVIEHCGAIGPAMTRLAALVRPQGHLLLVVSRPHWCQWLIWPIWRHRWFTPAQVIAAASQAGFSHQFTHPFAKGPPRRTSLGYLFTPTPQSEDFPC
jgi:2-polyprenyl-3-methyl-5-hydroxy-6-metoxy-1,4-benzoquinol methylase